MLHRRLKMLGLLFLVWFGLATAYSMLHYGLSKGNYLWFDHLSILGAGLSLALGSRMLVLVTLGIALIPLSLMMIDTVLRIFLHTGPIGVTEFLYQPGIPLYEFVIQHSFWFLLPPLFFALLQFREKPRHLARWSLGLQGIVFALSYFFFLPEDNLNCVYSACYVHVKDWESGWYSFAYPILASFVGLGISMFFDKLTSRKVRESKKRDLKLAHGVAGFFAASVAITIASTAYKLTLPRLSCDVPFENETVKVGCNFTTDYANNWMILNYSLWNKKETPRECASFIELNGEKDLLQNALVLRPQRETESAILIPYPKKDTTLRLSAECKDYE